MLGSILVALLPVACFDGLAAQGLPCEANEDCGPMLSCVDGCCGECPTSTTTAGSTVTTLSTGSTSATSDSATTTSGSSSTTLPQSECGNGVVEVGEDCEPISAGRDTPQCDADCTYPVCGDGYHNASAGESCDDVELVSGEPPPAGCLSCDLFRDDMVDAGSSNPLWRTEAFINTADGLQPWLDPGPPLPWRFVDDGENSYRGSGTYAGCEAFETGANPPCHGAVMRMETLGCLPLPPALVELPPDRVQIEVELNHAAAFDLDMSDGGRLELLYWSECSPGQPPMPVGEPERFPLLMGQRGVAPLACDCTVEGQPVCSNCGCPECTTDNDELECYYLSNFGAMTHDEHPNPYAGSPSYGQLNRVGQSIVWRPPPDWISLPEQGGIAIRFDATYSCRRQLNQSDDAWKIYGVEVRAGLAPPP